MAIHVVNEKEVDEVKSGRGFTKWLHVSAGGAGPEMMIRHWGPDTNIPVHSHPYHEMFYVLEGEIEIDGEEIVDAGWYRFDNLPQIPGKLSIARQLIDWFIAKHQV